ncbi:hypothetical protein l13_05720 [Neisseria weaveri ATCC 51223]|nr:hypothetical protein l13_05720 [Neisseria weaveri ATCC 51223]
MRFDFLLGNGIFVLQMERDLGEFCMCFQTDQSQSGSNGTGEGTEFAAVNIGFFHNVPSFIGYCLFMFVL